ncbi:MAG: alpha/beta fold hydrolase [Burkholderiaceae bacterium]|nr:alpha/beta fold hydrolase [Burkholderiaceae bacterium]
MIQTWLQPLPHGITLSCRAAGDPGAPVLMFLHGFPEAAFVWDELLAHFARPENGGYRCVAPNLRGFERSSSPPEVAAYRARHLVADIAALIAIECAGSGGRLECLVAHDWGGALAWNLANQQPQLMRKLAIVNSPHPGAFLRELQHNPRQQAASAYMNFFLRPDAEQLLAEDDFRRLWPFFADIQLDDAQAPDPRRPASPPGAWMTDAVREQYRAVWRGQPGSSPGAGLTGGLNYYRASPLRPPRPDDPAAAGLTLPREMLTVDLPTLVIWAMQDAALPPELIDGLDDWIGDLTLHRIADATHWVVHEQPGKVAGMLQDFLAGRA